MSIGLSIPMTFEDDYLDNIIELNNTRTGHAYIKEVYGARREDIIGNLRPSFTLKYISDDNLKKYIARLHKNGIEFNYVINSTVSDGREYTDEGRKSIVSYVKNLLEMGVDSFTITSSYYMILLKNHFQNININASICNEIDNVQKAKEFELSGANVLVLNRDINRNFKIIKVIKENTSAELKVLCTTPCVYRCPDVHYHSNLSSVLSNELQKYLPVDENNSISHTSVKCMLKKLVHLEENIKSPWIRPEDMKYYEEAGISLFKIDGRDRSAEYNIEVVKAYLNQSFDGNLLYLMKPVYPQYLTSIEEGKCTEYLRLGINNRELDDFLEPFIKGNIICDNGCEKCQYCKRISEKIIYDKEWICDFKKFLFKEIEKRYT